jgi:excisionase family DNA binding protein
MNAGLLGAGQGKGDAELLTLAEASALLRLSRNTVYKLCRETSLPARKVGRQWRVRRGDLIRWLARSGALPRVRPLAADDTLAQW